MLYKNFSKKISKNTGRKIRVTVATMALMMAATGTACSTIGNTTTSSVSSEIDISNVTATITLSNDGSSVSGSGAKVSSDGATITISKAGTYKVSGTLSEGRIVVDAENKDVVIVLDGVTLTCSDKAAIFGKNAKSLVVYTADGTENIITSGTEEDYEAAQEAAAATTEASEEKSAANTEAGEEESTADTEASEEESATDTEAGEEESSTDTDSTEDEETTEDDGYTNGEKAAIMAKCDLRLTGSGSLTVNGYKNNGVQSKGTLTADSVNLTVTASNDGIKAKTDINITDGTYNVTAWGDDIQSDGSVEIADGTFTLKTGEGASSASKKGGPGMGGQMPNGEAPSGEAPSGDATSGDSDDGSKSGERPELPDDFDASQLPDDFDPSQMTPPDTDSDSADSDQKRPEMPSGDGKQSGGQMPGGMDSSSDADDTNTVSQKGIKAGTSLVISGGTFTTDTVDDSVHSNGSVEVDGGSFEINAGDDVIHADTTLTVKAGTINVVSCYEGLEGTVITIEDGDIDIVASDDGMNAAGDADTLEININGGDIYVNAGGDGLDSNGDITFNGGVTYVDGPASNGDSAIDIGVEDGGIFVINGGQVTAVGMSGMLETVDESSTQTSVAFVFSDTLAADTEVTVTDSEGNTITTFTTKKEADSVILSTDQMKQGETYTFTYGDTSENITAEAVNATNYEGKSMGGMMKSK